MGVAYISSFWHSASYSNLVALNNLNLNIPQISPFSQSNIVDNSTQFPQFLKLSVSSYQFYLSAFYFLRSIGWNSIVVLATDDAAFYEEYIEVVNFAEVSGITILNPEDKRIFRYDYTPDDFEEYRSYFQAAKDTNCRLFVLLTYIRGYTLDGLYKIGMRKGDIYVISEVSIIEYLSSYGDEVALKHRGELLSQSFVIAYKEFNGQLGAQIQAELRSMFPSISFMCMCYDVVSVIKETIIYLLARGDDIEDPNLMQYTMRTNKLTGCLGTIYFDQEDNSRAYSTFLLQQIRQNSTTLDWYYHDIILLDKFSAKIMTVVDTIEWSLGTSTPSNFRPKNPCPFDSYEIIDSFDGKRVLYILSTGFFVVSAVSAFFSYKRFKEHNKDLKEKQVITVSDMVYIFYFVLQFLQIITQGPDQLSLDYHIKSYQDLFSLDINRYFYFKFRDF